MDDKQISNPEQYILKLEAELSKLQLDNQSLRRECQQLKDSNNHLKEIEESLMVREKLFSEIFYSSPVPMAIAKFKSATFLDVNHCFADMYGYKREDVIGKTTLELGIWGDTNERQDMMEEFFKYGKIQDAEYKLKPKTGEIRHVLASFVVKEINDNKYTLASLIDITERKKIEEALRASEEKFYKTFNNNSVSMVLMNFEDSTVVNVNDNCANALGFTREEIIGKNSEQLNIFVDLNDRDEIVRRSIEYGYVKDYEYQYKTRSGDIRTTLDCIDVLDIAGVKHMLLSGVDITERTELEENLRISNEKFSKAFHGNKAMMTISRFRDGVYIDVNKSWANFMGYEREEMIGKSSLELNLWGEPVQRQIMAEELSKDGYMPSGEVKYRKRSGDTGCLLASRIIINIDGENHILFSAIDISELKKFDSAISRLENLNIIGQMSASIAHEIRNPMTSLRGFLQMFRLQDKYQDDYEIMDLMVEELDRVNDIITDFLTLAQTKHTDIRLHSLKDNIIAILPLIKADAIKNNILVTTELQDVDQIMIGEGEIRQLVLNLVRNGIEAMSDGGVIGLKTFKDDNGINMIVEDTGHGIPSEVLDKIGTPFITTKKNGTGLGMAVCHNIADRNNAKITIDTSSEGTSFKVTFPVVA